MPVPAFTIDGVLPAYVGANGPGGAAVNMTPYPATVIEVIDRFATTPARRSILRDWLQHRAEMRALGVVEGFQWLDGSFVEDKIPADIDVVTFFHRPAQCLRNVDILNLFHGRPDVFRKAHVKARLQVDAMFVDLGGTSENIVESTRYYGGLFSHRRGDDLWKGMVRVALDGQADDQAQTLLDQLELTATAMQVGHEEAEIEVQGDQQ